MYSENQKLLLLLDEMNVSRVGIFKLLEKYSLSFDLIDLFINYENKLKEFFDDRVVKNIKNAILLKKHEKIAEKLTKMKIFCLFFGCEWYPEKLLGCKDAPIVLYTLGDYTLLSQKIIGVLGTRKPTEYGKYLTDYFVNAFEDNSLAVLSDLSYGINGLASSILVNRKAKTIALLAGGLDSIYPSRNTNLARQIVYSGGLLVSQYPPGEKPIPAYFSQRNRLLALLCDGVIVLEAGEDSGTLSSANYAVEEGRELFLVPGNINSPKSVGINKLISEIPHAFTISPVDVFSRLNVAYKNATSNAEKNTSKLNVSNDEKVVLDALCESGMFFDDLQEKTKFNSAKLSSLLTSLEISGLIKKLTGNYYEKN